MRYFVTGATGFIGGRLLHRLVEQGHEVAALVRDPARARHLEGPGVRLCPGDILDRTSLRTAMTGAEGVFHVAGWYKLGARNDREAMAVNRDGTRNVLETAGELRVPRVVHTSSLAVFSDTRGRLVDETYRHQGPWLSIYDRTKWIAHYEVVEPLARAGFPVIIVQPGLVYGPGDPSAAGETFRRYLRGKLPMIPRGAAFCWGHLDDTVDGHIAAMERGRPGESYIIAGPAHTLEEAFQLAERATGIPAPRLRPGPGVLRGMSATAAVLERLGLTMPFGASAEALRVSAGVTYLGSNAKAKRELGFEPRSMETGLANTLLLEMERLGLRLPEPALLPAGKERP